MKTLLGRALKLYLLDPKPGENYEHREIYNQAFEVWKKTWTRAFSEMGSPPPNPDNFIRQNVILAIAHGQEVAALHLYTIFDLRLQAHREHSYLTKHCTPKALAKLESQGVKRVMSMEYLCVDENYRSSKVGVNLSSVISGAGMEWAKEQRVDGVLGMARNEKNIDKLGKALGGEVLDVIPNLHNESWAVIGFLRENLQPHPQEAERELANTLWQNRIDTTVPAVAPAIPFRKKAA